MSRTAPSIFRNGNQYVNSSGTGGSGGNPIVDLILSEANGVTVNTEYAFLNSHTLSEYDELYIMVSTAADISGYNGYNPMVVNVAALQDMSYPKIFYMGYGTRVGHFTFTNTSFTQTYSYSGEGLGHDPVVYKIYGIKY